jgi:outer membrane protein
VCKKRIFVSVVFFLTLSLFFVEFVSAQLKIGYVNSQKILTTLPEAIDAQKKLEGESNKWSQELQAMEEEFKTTQEQLEQQSLLLSDTKKQERAQELQNLYVKMQQYQNDKWGENGEYFKRKEELFMPVISSINDAINKIGEDEKYDYIFDSVAGNILHAKEKYDLTEFVLEELEKETSKSSSKKGR